MSNPELERLERDVKQLKKQIALIGWVMVGFFIVNVLLTLYFLP